MKRMLIMTIIAVSLTTSPIQAHDIQGIYQEYNQYVQKLDKKVKEKLHDFAKDFSQPYKDLLMGIKSEIKKDMQREMKSTYIEKLIAYSIELPDKDRVKLSKALIDNVYRKREIKDPFHEANKYYFNLIKKAIENGKVK